jgi:hypothetical protein
MAELDDIDRNYCHDDNIVAVAGGNNEDGEWNERIQKGRVELNKI